MEPCRSNSRSQRKPGSRSNAPAGRESLLQAIGATLTRSLDAETAFQDLVAEIARALSVCRCLLTLLPGTPQGSGHADFEYRAECCAGVEKRGLELALRNGPAVAAALHDSPLFVAGDVGSDPRLASHRDQYLAAQIRSLVVVTIRDKERAIGLLEFSTCSPQSWANEEIDLIATVAKQVALVIRQAELLGEAKEAATRANLVTHIVTSMRRSLDIKEILHSAAVGLGHALGADRVYFRRRIGNLVVVEAQYASLPSYAVEDKVFNPDPYTADYLARNRKPVVIHDLEDFFLRNREEASRMASLTASPRAKAVIICPLFIENKLWGGFLIGQMDRRRVWTANEIALVEAVVAQLEIALAHSELFLEAKQAATIESLLRHIAQTINQATTMDQVYLDVGRELGEYFKSESLAISRYDPATRG